MCGAFPFIVPFLIFFLVLFSFFENMSVASENMRVLALWSCHACQVIVIVDRVRDADGDPSSANALRNAHSHFAARAVGPYEGDRGLILVGRDPT